VVFEGVAVLGPNGGNAGYVSSVTNNLNSTRRVADTSAVETNLGAALLALLSFARGAPTFSIAP
jgi:hypothetical protein